MTKGPKKLERPLFIDMDFGEALQRFAQTDPKEVDELKRIAKGAAEGDAPDDPEEEPKPKD